MQTHAIQQIPLYLVVSFSVITFVTLVFFVFAVRNAASASSLKNSIWIGAFLMVWLILQGILTLTNVYNTNLEAFPPKLVLFGIFPIVIIFLYLFNSQKGKTFMDSLPLNFLTLLNIVRIPVEIVLYFLYQENLVPQLLTFEGRNFDILAGISAPLVFYLGFITKKINMKIVLLWNILCLGILMNIVFYGLFSAPTPLQKFAFDQPNIALLNFSLSWLPTFVVPVVLFGHLVAIRKVLLNKF